MFLPHCSGVEACHDAPHSRLVNEVKTFHNVSECLCLDRNCNLKIIVFFSLPLSLASIFCQVVEINDSVAMLRKKLEEAEDARSVLLQARKSLRQDIRFQY